MGQSPQLLQYLLCEFSLQFAITAELMAVSGHSEAVFHAHEGRHAGGFVYGPCRGLLSQ